MLRHLAIKNYILINDISVDLSDKFNVFTGETGAGKSMLVDALNFVSGQRSSANIVGKHGDVARVEASFEFPENHPVFMKLDELGLYEEGETFLIITREMSREGRNVCRINRRIVNLTTIRDILDNVLDIHSQHETQYLLNAKNHLNLLDSYARNGQLQREYDEKYSVYQQSKLRIKNLKNSDINPNEIEFARAQLAEITDLKPSLDDYENLTLAIKEMSNFDKYKTLYDKINSVFTKEPGGLTRFYDALDLFADLDNEELNERYKDVYYQMEDIRDTISQLRADLNFDEFEFDRYQKRMYQYQQLLKKYDSIDDILEQSRILQERINQAENYDDILVDYENELRDALADVMEYGEILRDSRVESAAKLEAAVVTQLKDLMLENAQFKIVFDSKDPSSDGIDIVSFWVSMNKGESPSPLDKVASGGELSRLMLGLKVIFSDIYGISTLVFDEIDTGVSGRVGMEIGLKMKQLSKTAQVLTISHLSSVAACADHHYLISKAQDDEQTVTSITQISENERIAQLALIMSGSVSAASLDAAKELLEEGQRS
ncbi:DNA repair protein RecN [Erysipelothrix sp. HDW6C]|uniref:DNA repair protein RecN n=1 Tax=Erysipelothrix sp. HDW6C TaxID=2714930 RepID=UPI0014095DF8|nr:DNA repair protein RecN [Erysipelothrix sp. HDW6C]QIK70054.1 DNA repair protein RecN [Erysipelothrix sp. HDW6C]